MIQKDELRIGNWLQIGIEETLEFQVFNIFEEGVNRKECYDEDYPESDPFIDYEKYEDINGIPLTEEWMLNFGFTKYKQSKKNSLDNLFNGVDLNESELYYNTDEVIIGKKDGVFYLADVEYNTYEEWIIQPQYGVKYGYVHTLQNVCFFLTGKELTIKENQPV